METLDEVIRAIENCADVTDDKPMINVCEHCIFATIDEKGIICGRLPMMKDALHYLKLFQIDQTFDKQMENPPLTWDELRSMEGKPVWIDSVPLVRRWVIIKKFHPIGGNKNLFDMEVEDGAHFLRKNMRRDDPAWWQAYRKERE